MELLMLPVLLFLVMGPILGARGKSPGKKRAWLVHAVLVGGWLGFLFLLSADPGSTTSAGPYASQFFARALFWISAMADFFVIGLIGMMGSTRS